LQAARAWLSGRVREIPRGSGFMLAQQRVFVGHARRSIAQGARRDLDRARLGLDPLTRVLAPRARRLLARESESTEARRRRLAMADPQRVLERGYAILRLADGALLRGPEQAPAGTPLVARLRGGQLALVSAGKERG
jgi:exodeoxyribonuclease VII large subunit